MARRKEQAEADKAAALVGLGLADVSLSTAEKLTEHLKAPSGVDLHAIKFLGNGATILGAGLSGYEAIYGRTAEQRALGKQDLAFTAFGVTFPEAAPVVSIPYAAGRAFRDWREAVEASKPSILDEAAAPSGCP